MLAIKSVYDNHLVLVRFIFHLEAISSVTS